MRTFRDTDGKRVLEIDSLAFLYEREGYGWLRRHILNIRHKRAIRRADIIKVPDAKTAFEVEKYYFIPRGTVVVGDCRSCRQ